MAIHKGAKVDSRKKYSASAECVDCHADFQSARNDRKWAFSKKNSPCEKVDSRIFNKNAKNVSESQAEAVEMKNRGFLKKHRHSLSGIPCFQGSFLE